jgi:hypothetical protein
MTKRRSAFILATVCALLASAVVAQASFAQTTYTCANFSTGDFTDNHCITAGSQGHSPWGHVGIAVNTQTTETGSGGLMKIKTVQSGVTLELQSTEATATGTVENKEEAGAMWAQGKLVITFKGVTVTAPAGKGCTVKGGQIVTKELAQTSKGLTNQTKFSPASGETFASFVIEGCSLAALNHEYTAKGSLIGNNSGATTNFGHEFVTFLTSWFVNGQNAGLDGSVTLKGPNGNGLTYT